MTRTLITRVRVRTRTCCDAARDSRLSARGSRLGSMERGQCSSQPHAGKGVTWKSASDDRDDAARKLDDASGLRAAAADPVDDVPVQTPHANCKQDVCIELADALIAGE